MLYTRSTKTRAAGARVTEWELEHFTASEGEPAVALRAKCDDGKTRSLVFYGSEVDELKKKLNGK